MATYQTSVLERQAKTKEMEFSKADASRVYEEQMQLANWRQTARSQLRRQSIRAGYPTKHEGVRR